MSALAIENLTLAPATPRHRSRQVRGPQARPRVQGPVSVPRRGALGAPARVQAAACQAPAVASWRLTPRGVAVVTAASLLTFVGGAATVVTQFFAIPA